MLAYSSSLMHAIRVIPLSVVFISLSVNSATLLCILDVLLMLQGLQQVYAIATDML